MGLSDNSPDHMADVRRSEAERDMLRAYSASPASLGLTPPPLPLDFKLKCLELAIKAQGIVGLETEHYTTRADAFYDWLTGKDQTS